MRVCSTCGERNEDWMDICQRCGSSIMNAEIDNSYNASYNYNSNYSNNGYDDYNNANGYYSGPVANESPRANYGHKPVENMDLKIILIFLIIILLCLIGYIIFF
jgi:uncharacterized membrane protein YvbJ